MIAHKPIVTLKLYDGYLFPVCLFLMFSLVVDLTVFGRSEGELALKGAGLMFALFAFMYLRKEVAFFSDAIISRNNGDVQKVDLLDLQSITIHQDIYFGHRLVLHSKDGHQVSLKGRFGKSLFRSAESIAAEIERFAKAHHPDLQVSSVQR